MSDRIFNVLFLCTGNSARSILAESILSKDGGGRFRSFSAGSMPKPDVNPLAIDTLRSLGYPSEGFRSKSWDEFEETGAPVMDFVFTVCDNAAGEVCPIWPGHPQTAHWGIEDPAAVQGTLIEQKQAFAAAFRHLKNRISVFVALPMERLDKNTLSAHLHEIGRQDGASAGSLKTP
jgi:arsenate reductase